MPAKKVTAKTKQVSRTPQVKSKRNLILSITVVVGLLLAGLLFYWVVIGANMNTQAKMTKYLEDKYGKEFVVENVRREGYALGVEGSLAGDATSKDDGIKFNVYEGYRASYSDGYLQALWSGQESPKFSTFLKSINLIPTEHSAEVLLDRKLYAKLTGLPTFEDVLVAYGKDIKYGVKVVLEGEGPTEQDETNLRQLIEYVRQKNPLNYNVRYVINSKTANSYRVCQYYGGESNKGVRGNLTEEQYIDKCFVEYTGRE